MTIRDMYAGTIKRLEVGGISAVRRDDDAGYCVFSADKPSDHLLLDDEDIVHLHFLMEILYINNRNKLEVTRYPE